MMKHVLLLFFLFEINSIIPMNETPNEVIRMLLEHMTYNQRKSIARVSKVWNFLVNTFPQNNKTIVVVDAQHLQDPKLFQNYNCPIIVVEAFAERQKCNACDDVTLPWPLEDSSVLCDENIKRIRCDMHSGRYSSWKPSNLGRSIYEPKAIMPQQMVNDLKKKTNGWSLYIYCKGTHSHRAAKFTEDLLNTSEYLKTVKIRDCPKKKYCTNQLFLSYKEGLKQQIRVEADNSDGLSSLIFKREITKTVTYDPIAMINQVAQKKSTLGVYLETHPMQKPDFQKLVEIFKNNEQLNCIVFFRLSVKDEDHEMLEKTIQKAGNIEVDRSEIYLYKLKRKN